MKALNHMSVATIRQPRTLCSLENYDPPRREKIPLWNTETLHVQRSFILTSFTKNRLPAVKQREILNPFQSMLFRYALFLPRLACVYDAQQGLGVSPAVFKRHPVKKPQSCLEIARWLKVEDFQPSASIRLRAFDLRALFILALHFRSLVRHCKLVLLSPGSVLLDRSAKGTRG